jgi:hypothetical protein
MPKYALLLLLKKNIFTQQHSTKEKKRNSLHGKWGKLTPRAIIIFPMAAAS